MNRKEALGFSLVVSYPATQRPCGRKGFGDSNQSINLISTSADDSVVRIEKRYPAGTQRRGREPRINKCLKALRRFSQRLGTCLSFGRRQASAGEKDLGFVTQEDYNRLQDCCNNVGKLLNGLI